MSRRSLTGIANTNEDALTQADNPSHPYLLPRGADAYMSGTRCLHPLYLHTLLLLLPPLRPLLLLALLHTCTSAGLIPASFIAHCSCRTLNNTSYVI
jgi:hypothetical protein